MTFFYSLNNVRSTPWVHLTSQTGTPICLCITSVNEGRLKLEIQGDLKNLIN